MTPALAPPIPIPTPVPIPTPTPMPGGAVGRYLRDPAAPAHHIAQRLSDIELWVTGHAAVGLGAATAVVAVVSTVATLRRRQGQRRLTQGARMVEILSPPTIDAAGAQAMWTNLVGLLRPRWLRWWSGQPHVAFEYVFGHDGLTLRLWVPGQVPPGMVERAIEAAWPGARTTTTTNTTNVTGATGQRRRGVVAAGGELRLGRPEGLPIRTDFDADPIRALLGAPLDLDPAEHVVVQILARPAAGRRVTRAVRTARPAHQSGGHGSAFGAFLDLLTPGGGGAPGSRSPRTAAPADPVLALEVAAQNRAVHSKRRGPLFQTSIRYVATTEAAADNRAARAVAKARLRGTAHAVASAFAAFTGHNHYRRRRLPRPEWAVESRRFGRGDLLSVPELAAIAHLPTDTTAPGLRRSGARAIPPPPEIPSGGAGIKPLGVSDAGRARPVGVAVADCRYHTHLLGATGSGKSTLMAQLILGDAAAGRGVVVIDPKGDLVTDLLDRLPETDANRLVLFDADATVRPPCLNPLDAGGGAEIAVDNLTSIFARVYSATWGPRADDILRAACLTLCAQPGGATLADLPDLFTDSAARGRALYAVTDPVLQGFWSWYDQLSDAGRAAVIAPLMNKLRAFLLRPFVRAAIAGGPSTLDMPHILDGGICLVRIPKGSLGEDTTKLVGSLIVASVWQAAAARADQPQDQRHDAALYVDECQNFLNLPYPLEDMLAEARGFRLSMTLAHQHLGQLGPELKDGITANARNKIFFSASPTDARDLARHTTPRLTEHDLAHLGAYHAAARLVCRGQDTPAFTFATHPLPAATPGRARALRAAANPAAPAATATAATQPARRVDPRATPQQPDHPAAARDNSGAESG